MSALADPTRLRIVEMLAERERETELARGRFELRPEGAGTVLMLAHTLVPPDHAAGFGAGWHGHLDALTAVLAGQPADPHERYRQLRQYATRVGKAAAS